jgi:hypothetical protein
MIMLGVPFAVQERRTMAVGARNAYSTLPV